MIKSHSPTHIYRWDLVCVCVCGEGGGGRDTLFPTHIHR